MSMTGIMDNTLTSGQEGLEALAGALQQLRAVAVEVRRAGSGGCGVQGWV